jgi:hypothetical protein
MAHFTLVAAAGPVMVGGDEQAVPILPGRKATPLGMAVTGPVDPKSKGISAPVMRVTDEKSRVPR